MISTKIAALHGSACWRRQMIGGALVQTQTIDVSRLVDDRKIGALNIKILIITSFLAMFEGYDQSSLGFVAPALIRDWHIAHRGDLGPVFSVVVFGNLIGAPVFGYIGDRFGRKNAILLSILLFAVFTIATPFTSDLKLLFYVRLLVGFGLGGALPNLVAINADFAPKTARATMIIIMSCGLTAGAGVVGLITAWLMPHYGWQIVFWIGGLAPILVLAVAVFVMPELIKYLVLKARPRDRAEIARLASALDPLLVIGPDTQFVLAREKVYRGISPKYLFRDGLAIMTPAIWITCMAGQTGLFFFNNYVPTILNSAGMSPANAAWALTAMYLGGEFGPLLLCRPLDHSGFNAMTILFAVSIVAVACLGVVGTSQLAITALLFVTGACILGVQAALHVPPGMIYPTSIRANGAGWAFGIARFGTIFGTLVGGMLLNMGLPLSTMFLVASVPYIVGTIASMVLASQYKKRLAGAMPRRPAVGEA